MRNESTMYQLFTDIASKDSRILAVYMNGSRTNIHAPKDIFQDYDIVFVVTETKPFIEASNWIQQFGTILYMQYPDESPDYPSDKENFYGWLMQFDDGVRVDLHVESLTHAREHIGDDRLCRILLDKEHVLPEIAEATDADYHVKKPSQEQFHACTNEFWWCSNNLAKGLWREELPYVQDMANFIVRKELEKMLAWNVGLKTDFTVSVGKSAKYLYKWICKEEYENYLNTYFGGTIEGAWKAVFLMCDLFDRVSRQVAEGLGYLYHEEEAKAARGFLEHVYRLPKDAQEIF
ncbi:MAG: aminoglycoside 6-adenylyltransferase [Lachnospiraceae bacterium]|nr:aminoglycoside 6-adenylyltransferase [Lachnospiraceae bacterium]